MKMNNLTFTSMKKSIKYICLFLMLMGINTGVWAGVIDKTNYTISTDAIDFGDLDASDDDYQSAGYIETYQEITITLKTARTTYAYFWASPDEYYMRPSRSVTKRVNVRIRLRRKSTSCSAKQMTSSLILR